MRVTDPCALLSLSHLHTHATHTPSHPPSLTHTQRAYPPPTHYNGINECYITLCNNLVCVKIFTFHFHLGDDSICCQFSDIFSIPAYESLRAFSTDSNEIII